MQISDMRRDLIASTTLLSFTKVKRNWLDGSAKGRLNESFTLNKDWKAVLRTFSFYSTVETPVNCESCFAWADVCCDDNRSDFCSS